MKNLSNQLQQLILTEKHTSTESKKTLMTILCSSSKPATHACMNQNCKKQAFVCQDQECQCQKNHQKCLTVKIITLFKNIQSKKVSVESLQTCINQKIQQMIDLLSKFRDQTIKQMKQDFQFFGLNHNEIQFLKQVNIKKSNNMSGKKIWNIIISSKQERQIIPKAVEQTCQLLSNNFIQSMEFYQQKLKKTTDDIKACNDIVQKSFITKGIFNSLKQNQNLIDNEIQFCRSKILTSLNEIQTIKNFFNYQSIKQAKLIYRATDNDFESSKFHMKCDGISNTLIIVQTEFGKKIGGFTPIKWNSVYDGVYQEDQSMKSFLFSLTYGDKFTLSKNKKAIKHYSQYGPVFGGHDFGICNKSNQNRKSWSNINHAYKNQNYKQQDKQSWIRFCGNPTSSNFKIIQWQVWSLQFK